MRGLDTSSRYLSNTELYSRIDPNRGQRVRPPGLQTLEPVIPPVGGSPVGQEGNTAPLPSNSQFLTVPTQEARTLHRNRSAPALRDSDINQ